MVLNPWIGETSWVQWPEARAWSQFLRRIKTEANFGSVSWGPEARNWSKIQRQATKKLSWSRAISSEDGKELKRTSCSLRTVVQEVHERAALTHMSAKETENLGLQRTEPMARDWKSVYTLAVVDVGRRLIVFLSWGPSSAQLSSVLLPSFEARAPTLLILPQIFHVIYLSLQILSRSASTALS